jgi:tryptophan-rich sensory protein
MVKNYFYLAVGVLCILFAGTHTVNGVSMILEELENSVLDDSVKTAFTYVWHIIGIENLVFGIALIIMAFQKGLSKVRFAAWLIIAILALRWVVISFFTLRQDSSSFMQIMPDTVAIMVLIVLLVLGTRVRDKVLIM